MICTSGCCGDYAGGVGGCGDGAGGDGGGDGDGEVCGLLTNSGVRC